MIEAKSDLAAQRDQVIATAKRVKALALKRTDRFIMGAAPPSIPVIAIGFRGWQGHDGPVGLLESGVIDAAYEIEAARCSCVATFMNTATAVCIQGPSALLALVEGIRRSLTRLLVAETSLIGYSTHANG